MWDKDWQNTVADFQRTVLTVSQREPPQISNFGRKDISASFKMYPSKKLMAGLGGGDRYLLENLHFFWIIVV